MNFLKAAAVLILLSFAGCGNPFPENAGVTFQGQAAQAEVIRMGIPIPPEVKDLYYHAEGFIDPTEFVSFSVDPTNAEKVLKKFANVSFSKFVPWKNQIEEKTGCREPGHFDNKGKSNLYDADSFQDAIFYSDKSKTNEGYYFIYDRVQKRLFICHWIS